MHYKTEIARERDLNILKELYEKRLLTIEQMMSKFSFTKSYSYKLCSRLFKSGLIQSKGIKGYTLETGKRGRYYRITTKGVSFLIENGYEAKYHADALRVSDMRIPHLIEQINMEYALSSRFLMLDSRETKEKYGLNRGDNLQGVLSSPVLKDYPFYIFLNNNNISDLWLAKIVREVNKYSFRDMLMLTSSLDTFNRIFTRMFEQTEYFTYETFRILPIKFAIEYFKYYVDTDLLYDYIEDELDIMKLERVEDDYYSTGFDLVEYGEEEYYLVNMIDNNISNLHHIKLYTKEQYERDGRKLLILTNGRVNFEQLLETVHHAEYIEIDIGNFFTYGKSNLEL